MTALIFALILTCNARFIFDSRQFEMNDYAVNSLQVLNAKHGQELLGHYCRFGFHHPGPAFFYLYALGEALFYDALRLVPTPFNAQLIAYYCISAFFLSAALIVIAQRIGRAYGKWFIGIALLCAIWHFGAVGKFYEFIPGHLGLFCIWPPCVVVLPFLCFLVAVASVASGGGSHLPLMALTGSFLVHGYGNMPLFVVPLSLLAYLSLGFRLRRMRPSAKRWPWQAFVGPHWRMITIIALFLLPMLIDVAFSHPNNIQMIIAHMRNGYGGGKGLLRSLLYFCHFGAYSAYPNTNVIPAFEAFDFSGTLLFFRTHWRAYSLWCVVMFLPIFTWRAIKPQSKSPLAISDRVYASSGIAGFVCCFYASVTSALLLTLVWGCILEGPMYYYVGFFNFAIYYGFILIFAVSLACLIENGFQSSKVWTRRRRRQFRRVFAIGPSLLVVMALLAFRLEVRRFASAPPAKESMVQFSTALDAALACSPSTPTVLNFEEKVWAEAAGIAVYLERRGRPWMVTKDWPVMFGREHVMSAGGATVSEPDRGGSGWRVVPSSVSLSLLRDDPTLHAFRIAAGVDLVVPSPP